MEQQIINILEKYSIKNSDVTGEWSLLEDDMFPQVAKEIMKLYNHKTPFHICSECNVNLQRQNHREWCSVRLFG